MEIQVAFFHFRDDHVQVMVDGRRVFDRVLTVAPENGDYGLADIVRMDLPTCSDMVVTSRRLRVAQRLCLEPGTKGLLIDAGPPLTVAAQDHLEGID